MTLWRPPQIITAKVIGLVRRQDQWLLARVDNDDGTLKGYRPLGGTIHFGETREAALEREFQEELGCGVSILSPWVCLENIYQHHGTTGHEMVFAARAELGNAALMQQDSIAFHEDDGTACLALWLSVEQAEVENIPLYPDGIAGLLRYL